MVGILIAALMASIPTAPTIAPVMPAPTFAAPPAPTRPALWVARDGDTTIYLFGTFHALDGRSQWFNAGLRQALSSSDELVLETLIPSATRLQAAAFRQPGPLQGFAAAPGNSFVAGTRLAVTAGRDHGMDVSSGADMVLRDAAEAEGKPVEGLESLQFQFGMFNRMAAVPDRSVPQATAEAKARLSAVMRQMELAWTRGDQHLFAAMLDQMRRSSPENYRLMFPERNARWADWIVNRMDQPGTVFVAVGAGHFAGPDSVQSQLTLRGVVATRLN